MTFRLVFYCRITCPTHQHTQMCNKTTQLCFAGEPGRDAFHQMYMEAERKRLDAIATQEAMVTKMEKTSPKPYDNLGNFQCLHHPS